MSRAAHVLVTRPEAESHQTTHALEALGITVTQAPCLHIMPLPASPLTGAPDALLLTSQHAVPAVAAARLPLSIPLFVVGARTAEKARAAGFTQVHIGKGAALSLLPLLHQELPAPAHIAYLHGEDTRHDMERLLQNEGYRVESRCVYRAEHASQLPQRAIDALKAGDIDGILFYSVRTLEAFAQLAATCLPAPSWQSVAAIVISDTVANAARAAGFTTIHVLPLHEGTAALATLKTLFS